MTKLILHIGPAKCGSTSIQKFFFTQKNPCIETIHYLLLDPLEIEKLDSENPPGEIIANYSKLLLNNMLGCDALILSHEVLFQRPHAVKNICDLAKTLFEEITIIGFSRKQGDFLVSAYSQWNFRSLSRTKKSADTLNKLGVNPILFSGLEQQLIASIENDFDINNLQDWHNSYKAISLLIRDSKAVIKCGVLPNKQSSVSLIQDFCEKADLTLHEETSEASWIVANPSFNQDIVEAVNNAVSFGLIEIPEFHENNIQHNEKLNNALILLSSKIDTMERSHQSFLSKLKEYINTYYLNANRQLCREYGLDEAYFAPSREYSKEEILSIIVQETQQRAMNKSVIINDYRMLSARMIELSLKLTLDITALEHHLQILHEENQLLKLSKSSAIGPDRGLYTKLINIYQRLRDKK